MANTIPRPALAVLAFLLIFAGDVRVSAKSPNGLGMTPQMGWDNWNSAGCDGLSEKLILDTAQKIVDYGYAVQF